MFRIYRMVRLGLQDDERILMQVKELFQSLLQAITVPVSDGERQTVVRWLLEDRLGVKPNDLIMGKDVPVTPQHFAQDLKRLNDGEPLQYILGHASFYGRRFRVNSAVLIPRPETEILVKYVIDTLGRNASVSLLDIGTGTGCIAVTLALEMRNAIVHATDFDPQAFAVAKDNARQLNARVNFRLHNILEEELPFEAVDAIISNPPYIRESEKNDLSRNVAGYEPHQALFVPDDDPVVFHRIIAQKAALTLKPGGLVAMEINEKLGQETLEAVRRAGFSNASIHKDLDGKDRFVTGTFSS